jgi:hypothetical protein
MMMIDLQYIINILMNEMIKMFNYEYKYKYQHINN